MGKTKVYIDNSDFIECVSEITAEITNEHFDNEHHRIYVLLTKEKIENNVFDIKYTEQAQDFFNNTWDQIETTINTMGVYSSNELID